MTELSLQQLAQHYLKDSFEWGSRLRTDIDDHFYEKTIQTNKQVDYSTFGLKTGTVNLHQSQRLGSTALSIRNNTIYTEIARIPPFHPDILPMAAFSQRGKGETLVSISPGRTAANKIDKLFIEFKKISMKKSIPHEEGDSWIAIGTNGKIIDTNLPPRTKMSEVASQARTVLQAIRDGKPITAEKWLRRYAKWKKQPSHSEQ